VAEARAAAARLGFEGSSLDEVGQLLATLTASRPGGRIGEVGTGTGVAAAWIASALAGGATLVTVELDEARAAAASSLLEGESGCTTLHGDWREVLPPHAPFDLLFFDGAQWKRDPEREAPHAVALLAPGGLLVIDDLTPVELWPEEWRGQPDRAREWLAANPLLRCVEVRTSATAAAVIAARIA
jgi:predicted O-methyltransferase YrrM